MNVTLASKIYTTLAYNVTLLYTENYTSCKRSTRPNSYKSKISLFHKQITFEIVKLIKYYLLIRKPDSPEKNK